MSRRTRYQWLSLFRRPLRFESLEDRLLLANVTVSKVTDVVDGNTTSIAALVGSPGADGGISLREAILAANADNTDASDAINFSVSGTIQLTNSLHVGELAINTNLTINGPGASLLTIRALNPSATLGDGARIFNIDDFFSFTTKTVAISGLTLTGGDMAGNGGAILNSENLTVTACVVSGNSAGTATTGQHGGGIANVSGGNLTIIGSTISGNTSKGRGGGIYSYLGSLTVARSTISGNSTGSTNTGGGIHSQSSTTSIDSSTISGNSADGGGGGILQEGAAITINNSTISSNSARSIGGGVAAFAGMTVRHSTITLNRSDSDNSGGETGGGLFRGSGSTTIDHTIVAGNLRGTGSIRDDISGAVTARYSLIGDNTGATIANNGGNQIGTGASPINALLGPLANDAGQTLTHALLTGSPAIDTGDPVAVAGLGNLPLSDQRGGQFTRVSGGRIDLGAFERQSFVVDTLADENDGNYTAGDFSLREAIGLVNAGSVGADTITFAASLTSGGPATILLTQGELAIAKSLTINGPGASLLTIDASGNDPTPAANNGDGSRVFNLDDGNSNINKTTALSGLTLTGGDVSTKGAGILSREALTLMSCTISGNFAVGSVADGGGIYSGNSLTTVAALTITNSTISGNSAGSTGGGVFSKFSKSDVINSTISGNTAGARGGGICSLFSSDLTLMSSTVSGNTASLDGGGIFSGYGGSLAVTSSTISGNTAGAKGGGVWRNATVGDLTVIQQSTITDNEASSGGGIHCQTDGTHSQSIEFRVADSTISGNRANQYGGGIYSVLDSDATLLVQRSTITLNRADADNSGAGNGGGIVNFGTYSSLSDTIVAGNLRSVSTRDDFLGFVIASFSLIGVDTGATIITTGGTLIGTSTSPIDPRLAPLANNGGPTMTHALLGGSLAMDAGDPAAVAGTGGVPAFDQRGSPFGRVNDGNGMGGARIDMGAIESPPPPPLPADYNHNNIVDAADYVLWRKTLGTSGLLPFAGADGNGNGNVGSEDHSVWRANFGATAPAAGAGVGSLAPAASGVVQQPSAANSSATTAEPVASRLDASQFDRSVLGPSLAGERDVALATLEPVSKLKDRSQPRGIFHRFDPAEFVDANLLLMSEQAGRSSGASVPSRPDRECNARHTDDAIESLVGEPLSFDLSVAGSDFDRLRRA